MREEAVVLGGEHRVDHRAGHLVEPDRTVILARTIHRAREHLAFERHGRDVLAAVGDPGDTLVLDLQPHQPRIAATVLGATQEDLPRAAGAPELARRPRGGARLVVAEPSEGGRERDALDVDPRCQRLSGRVDVRRAARIRALEPDELDDRVDDRCEQPEGEDGQEHRPAPTGERHCRFQLLIHLSWPHDEALACRASCTRCASRQTVLVQCTWMEEGGGRLALTVRALTAVG